jgi:alkylation response protein AidB-like acyl-CoA dehydrogenase
MLRERASAQAAVAQAEALLGSARSYLYEALAEVWETATSGGPSTLEQRAKLRLASCHAAIACAKAVDLMYTTGGGSSIFDHSLLQRCSRDVHAATQHLMVAPDSMEDVGRVLLGLPSGSPLV